MFKKAVLFLSLLSLVLVACGGRQSQQTDSGGVNIDLEITNLVVGESTLMITLTSAGGEQINDASLSVRGDMTHAGMTPVVREIDGGENGVYIVPFEWTMAGDWIITVDATLADGQTVTRRFEDLKIAGEMDG